MRRLALLFLFVSLLARPAAGEDDSRVAWLAKNAVRLRSIDPKDDDFADLAPLRKVLDGVRIVQLGEPTHGDGAAFLARTRIIEFLHREMGFDVLAFESGLYDCKKAWDAYRAGVDPREAGRKGIFGIWSRSEQVLPLLDYLGEAAKTEKPLELCGFDCQLTASASRESLVADLDALVERRGLDRGAAFAGRGVVRWMTGETKELSERDRAAGRKALRDLAAAVAKGEPDREDAYWIQLLESLAVQIDVHHAQKIESRETEDLNRRDIQMGKNLLWLAKQRYPGRKIIVWAATYHIARNLKTLDTGQPGFTYEKTVNMGQVVADALGEKVYTLNVTAYEGAHGRWFRPAVPLAAAAKGSFEDLCVRAGLENAWIDLRGAGRSGKWLREPMSVRGLAYGTMRGDWGDVADGILFLKTMTPSTRAGAAPPIRPPKREVVNATSILPKLEATWRRIEHGMRTGNVWVDKWDFSSDWEAWKKAVPEDEKIQIAEEERVAGWLKEKGKAEHLAWRVHLLLAEMAADRGDRKTAIGRLDAAIAGYPDRTYADPAKHGKLQHLVNRRGLLLWDEKGFARAFADAAKRLETDRRFRYFHPDPWTERLTAEGKGKEMKQLTKRLRKAYGVRAKRFRDQAEEAKRYADQLR